MARSRDKSRPASGATLSVPVDQVARARASSFGFHDSGVAAQDASESTPSIVWSALCCNSGRGSLSWTGLGIVFSSLAAGSLGISLLLESLGDRLDALGGGWYTSLGSLAVLLVLVAAPFTHALVGVRKNGPLYNFFQPFVGGLRFVFLQFLAWTIYTFTLLGGVYAVWVGGRKLTSGWMSAVGVGGMLSQLLVLVSLHFFVSNASTNQNASVDAIKLERVRSRRANARERRRKAGRKESDESEDAADAAAVDAPGARTTEGLAAAASSSFWPWSSIAMKLTFLVIATLSLVLALFVGSLESGSSPDSVSIYSLLTSATLIAVPITHLLARRSLTHAGYLLFQPFKGGVKFVALQALAWTFWTLAFLSAIFVLIVKHGGANKAVVQEIQDLLPVLPAAATASPGSFMSNLITSAGVGAMLSQALVLLSLKYFDSRISRKIGSTARVIEFVRRGSERSLGPLALDEAASSPVARQQLEKDVLDRAVQALASPSPMLHQRQMWSSLPAATVPIPPPKPEKVLSSVEEDEYEVPTLTLPPFIQAERPPAESPESPITPEPSTLTHVTLRDLTQISRLAVHYVRSQHLLRELLLDVRSILVISVLYLVPIIGAILTFGPPVLMYMYPVPWYLYAVYGTLVFFYLTTYRNRPSLTGARSWPALRESGLLWDSMERYFNGTLVPMASLEDCKGPYIFGFHPHGIYPMTCFWATHSSQFRRHFPDLRIDVCGASIMFFAPIMREVISWSGGREVSGTAIRHALKNKRSIMLVPGGQREMGHSAADYGHIKLVTRHRGFIRMALEHGTPLVPVLSIGETMLLENVHAPRMQAYTLRTVGVGFPIWPFGRWYSPLPNSHPVVVIFGQPIPVPLSKDPSPSLIDEIHNVYYSQLQSMFESHKHMIPEFENAKLIFSDE